MTDKAMRPSDRKDSTATEVKELKGNFDDPLFHRLDAMVTMFMLTA